MDKKLNIMSLGTFDAAGVQTNFANCWNKYGYGTWRTYFMNDFMKLKTDLTIDSSFKEIVNVINSTDIFLINVVIDRGEINSHLINDWDTIIFSENNNLHLLMHYIADTKKPIIFFINGSNNVRQWSSLYNQIFKEKTNYFAVSTPDLLEHFPTAEYFPGFIDVEDKFWNLPIYKKDFFWIAQFPTNPQIKNTKEFIHVSKELQNLNIKSDIINGIPHMQSINYRRDMDMTFDHLGGYYGINSLESAALGIINMVHLTDNNKKIFCEVAGVEDTPWDLVETIEDVKEKILLYYNDRELLDKRKKEVKQWMKDNWHPKKHLSRMKKYFEDILNETINNIKY